MRDLISIPFALVLAVVALAAMLGAAACGGGSSGTTTTPSVTTKTETFSGTVAPQNSDSHSFTVSQTGEVDVTLTAAGPPSTIVMGLGVGVSSGSRCTLIAGASTQTAAGSTAQLSGKVSPGSLCVQVYDVGSQTAPITYTVSVTHP